MYTANSKQIPDHSIFDEFNKQCYLGNQFIFPIQGVPLAGTSEVPIAFVINPATSPKALFFNRRVLSSSDQVIFRFYANPIILSNGVATIPANLRVASTNQSVATAFLTPISQGTFQIETINTVADVSGSLNSAYFFLTGIFPAGVQDDFYVWYNVGGTGTDPGLGSPFTAIPVAIPSGASAAAVATATRAAIATLTNVFTVAGTGNSIIVTNVNRGFSTIPFDGSNPTFFTFINTFPGNSSFGNFLLALAVETFIPFFDSTLFIIDPGNTHLVTVQAVNTNTTVFIAKSWYEL